MKNYLLLLLISLSCMVHGQSTDSTNTGFGVALDSQFNTQLNVVEIAPMAVYFSRNSQFELGFGLNPYSQKDQRVLSGRFSYKYFPNGKQHKYMMYFVLSCSYTNQFKKTYYPLTNHYVFVSGGYGIQLKIIDNLNLGSNVRFGSFTNSTQSENPYLEQLGAQKMFDSVGMNISFQVHIGYRF